MKIIIISAVAKNRVIGRSNGEMPWHVKEEFQHFKNTTFGFPVIMGRKTFQTLGKPLKGRDNIIVTRDKSFKTDFDDVRIFYTLPDALKYAESLRPEKIFIIGGGEIYRQSLSLADQMIISEMNFEADGDVYFPEIDSNNWKEKARVNREQFDIVYYEKKSND